MNARIAAKNLAKKNKKRSKELGKCACKETRKELSKKV